MNSVPAWAQEIISPLDTKLGLTLETVSPHLVVGSIPVAGNEQPFGALHGGASAALIETLGSLGALAHGRPSGLVGVGTDLNITHTRPASSGLVRGEATAVHLGRSSATYSVQLTDEAGNTTAVGRITCRLIEPRAQ